MTNTNTAPEWIGRRASANGFTCEWLMNGLIYVTGNGGLRGTFTGEGKPNGGDLSMSYQAQRVAEWFALGLL